MLTPTISQRSGPLGLPQETKKTCKKDGKVAREAQKQASTDVEEDQVGVC